MHVRTHARAYTRTYPHSENEHSVRQSGFLSFSVTKFVERKRTDRSGNLFYVMLVNYFGNTHVTIVVLS